MQKYTAIILCSREANEFDRIYIFYTKEAGVVKAIGRGVRKPSARLAGHLEPGTMSEVYIARSRGMGQITGAITLDEFPNVKKNFEKLKEALKIFSYLSRFFSEGNVDERVFRLLADFLNILNEVNSENLRKLISEAFWWKLFDFSGQRPEVLKCALCGVMLQKEEKIFFSANGGGTICRKCGALENGILPISENQIKLIRLFLANSLEKIAKVKIDEKELPGLERIRKVFGEYNS